MKITQANIWTDKEIVSLFKGILRQARYTWMHTHKSKENLILLKKLNLIIELHFIYGFLCCAKNFKINEVPYFC